MKRVLTAAGALALATTAAQAGGIDRSGQSIGAIFEKGSYAEFSFGSVNPTASGNDVALFGGSATGNVAKSYTQIGGAYKRDFTDKLSFALIFDQPFGADINYPAGKSVAFGGTVAKVTSNSITGVLRYKMSDNVSLQFGARADSASGSIALNGAAYGAASGYSATLSNSTGYGYLVGAAYEIPDIALRVALTYNSEITHKFSTTETGPFGTGTSTTTVKTPKSVNLDFQTGINTKTLLFAGIRWVNWSAFDVAPIRFKTATGGGLVSLSDTTTYTIGAGRKFNDAWSGAMSISYEAKGNPLVSPLAPTNGKLGLSLAAIYNTGSAKITTGINYTKLGDAQPQTSNTARANFTGNYAVGVGVKIGYSF